MSKNKLIYDVMFRARKNGDAAGSGYWITYTGESVISPCDVCGDVATYEYDGKRKCEEHYKQSPKAEQEKLL